jgi:hypothetical protein
MFLAAFIACKAFSCSLFRFFFYVFYTFGRRLEISINVNREKAAHFYPIMRPLHVQRCPTRVVIGLHSPSIKREASAENCNSRRLSSDLVNYVVRYYAS